MKRTLIAAGIIACLAGFASVGFSDDDPAKPAMEAGSHDMGGMDAGGAAFEFEKASPEHIKMRRLVGEWESTMSMVTGPGEVAESKGSSKCTQFGEFWIIEDAEYEVMGMPFKGHGVYGYNAGTKKYTSSWVDSTASWSMNSEGDMDKDGTLVFTATGPDYMNPGKMTTYTMKESWDGDDTRIMRSFVPGPDGKQVEMWKLTATRKK